MKKLFFLLLAAMLSICHVHAASDSGATPEKQKQAAEATIQKFITDAGGGSFAVNVTINPDLKEGDKDKFTYTKTGSGLDITATNGVAACRAFYDFVKSNGAGICSWTANRFDAAVAAAATTKTTNTVTSPYRDHQYFNVVTYGYSMPYWDEERWDKEIMWMAMHGIDMPLMLVGSEGIYYDVFKNHFHCTDQDIHDWEVGPAHLPWMRMGNLAGSKFDGPLNEAWYENQKALAKHILAKMYELGMRPILPAFGGFVPPKFAERNPGAVLTNTGWGWVKNRGEHNTRLEPSSSHFVAVGKKFIELWEKEFHESYPGMKYYLSDSFNEMTVPGVDALRTYGQQIYASIADAPDTYNDAERVWVTQGWEFVYGQSKWTNGTTRSEKFKALTQGIPQGRFMSLYMSPEYERGATWVDYDNFSGTEWNHTLLPNMGGKNFWTGNLESYANTWPKRLRNGSGWSTCSGWGMTPEGIEYNELLYELIADMGWTDPAQGKVVNDWIAEYGTARYGETDYTQELKDLHATLKENVYSSYKDHQTFGWQGYNRTSGYYTAGNIDYLKKSFFTGFETFFNDAHVAALKEKTLSPTLRADLIEFAAFYASARVEKINSRIVSAHNEGNTEKVAILKDSLKLVMLNMDRALSAHPLYDLQKWEDKAKSAAKGNTEYEKQYVRDARSIVSTWHSKHGPNPNDHEDVNDYAGRLYAGLIRGYYLPRLLADLDNLTNNAGNNLRTVENDFVSTDNGIDLMKPQVYNESSQQWEDETTSLASAEDDELLDFLAKLVKDAAQAGTATAVKDQLKPSTLEENHWYAIHTQREGNLEKVFTSTGSQSEIFAGFGIQALGTNYSQYWRVIAYADGTYRLENRNGQSLIYDGGFKTSLIPLYAETQIVKDPEDMRYAFKLNNAGTAARTWMHYNNGLTMWNDKEGSSYIEASTWTFEEVTGKLDAIAQQSDYDRYRTLIEGFRAENWGNAMLYNRPGQPKSLDKLNQLITALSSTSGQDALTTFDRFYTEIYAPKLKDCFTLPTGAQACKLFDLIMNAMVLPVNTGNTVATTTFRKAMHQAMEAVANGVESDCTTQMALLERAVKTYMTSLTAEKLTGTKKIADGNKFVLKNISKDRNACLVEKSDGELRIEGDVTGQLSYDPGYVFTLVADGDKFKLQTASGKFIPCITAVTPNSNGAKLLSSETGDAFTFNYVTGDAPYWTIEAASKPGNYLYNFGPGYLDGRLLLGTSAKIDDGCKFELYLVSEAEKPLPELVQATGTWNGNSDLPKMTKGDGTTMATKYCSASYEPICVSEDNVSLTAGDLSVTFTYTNGNWGLNLLGIDLVKDGQVVKSDYHAAFTGGGGVTATYTLTDVPADTYTFRYWVPRYQEKTNQDLTNNNTDARGNITYSLGGAAQSQFTNKSWNTKDSFKNRPTATIPTGVWNTLRTECWGTRQWAQNAVGEANWGITLNNGIRIHDEQKVMTEDETYYIYYRYTTGSHALDLKGVELIDHTGKTVAYDFHDGSTGTNKSNATYKVTAPSDGTYTVRTITSNQNNNSTQGNITYYAGETFEHKVAETQTKIAINAPGYPKSTDAVSTALDATNFENNEGWKNTGDAFYNVCASTNINLLEDGKAYYVKARFQNGDYAYITNGENNHLKNSDTPTTAFVAKKVGNTFALVGGDDGKFFIIEAQGKLSNEDKTVYTTKANLTIAKQNPNQGQTYNSTTALDMLGCLTIKGQSSNGTFPLLAGSDGTFRNGDTNQYFYDYKPSGSIYRSCEFEIEPINNPNDVKLSKPEVSGSSILNGRFVGTFSAPYDVELKDGVEAYTAELNEDKTILTFHRLGTIVPKNTGVLVYSENAVTSIADKAVPAAATAEAMPSTEGNVFEGSNAGNVTMASGHYILSKGSQGVAFYPAKVGSELARNKAYLNLAGVSVREMRFELNGETTAIVLPMSEEKQNAANSAVYDLSGRKVKDAQNGIYIVNGKKVVK
ncbi:MAG: alpha-N-acetylglucosaminidase C-terminal domain-containing protein [Bacteroidales bacterium]|nr:alpha-N-acetylglucosaminidase C-terminal domain-containing protein [Candidatus Physcousia equi]